MKPAPFLKWVGGKRQLLPQILPLVPAKVATYYEPFLGGGAVFFALAHEGRFERAVLSDVNQELVTTYRAIQADVEAVIRELGRYRDTRPAFLRARAAKTDQMSPAEIAARMIFLNKCGFNGLYRVNADGKFNVPYGGGGKGCGFYDAAVLRAAALALEPGKVEIRAAGYQVAIEATPGDFVYLDPPYVPASVTADFTAFTAGGFGFDDQDDLARMFGVLAGRGVGVLASNADCQLVRFLYRRHQIASVAARRAINSDGAGRGPVREVLVTPRPSRD